jgi:hypothetical protein
MLEKSDKKATETREEQTKKDSDNVTLLTIRSSFFDVK